MLLRNLPTRKQQSITLTLPTVGPLSRGKKDSDFLRLPIINKRALAYKNIEKLLYLSTTRQLSSNTEIWSMRQIFLYQKELLSAVMMRIISHHRHCFNKQAANKLLLNYKDHSSEKLNHQIPRLISPIQQNTSLRKWGLPTSFQTTNHCTISPPSSTEVPGFTRIGVPLKPSRRHADVSLSVKQTEALSDDQFAKTKQQLEGSLKKLCQLMLDLPVIIQLPTIFVDNKKSKHNKEALLPGLTYAGTLV